MKYRYECIKHTEDLPLKMFIHGVDEFPYHWHEELEILLVLKGSLRITLSGESRILQEEDVIVVNSNELHTIHSLCDHGITQVLALQFRLEYFEKFNLNLVQRRFVISSETGQKFRYHLAHMMSIMAHNKEPVTLQLESDLLQIGILLINLDTSYGSSDASDLHMPATSEKRITKILSYLNKHALDCTLSLQRVAEYFGLNPQYLSRYFKEQTGTTLKRFVDHIRLQKSLPILRASDQTIMTIALDFGFPDAKAYYRVFREVLGITPKEYRASLLVEQSQKAPSNYFTLRSQNTLKNLFRYLDEGNTSGNIDISQGLYNLTSERYELSSLSKGTEVSWNMQSLCTFGYASHGLRKDLIDSLWRVQQDIGFSYVRFHGIFSDQLRVCNRRGDGSLYYNFVHIDALLDNLLACNIKPFIELGFMPEALARNGSTIFWWKAGVSPPQNIGEWIALLEAFFTHILNRYGAQEVEQWHFEFWNEPEISNVFWTGTEEEFFEFFLASYRCIKSIHPALKVGGFGNIGVLRQGSVWIEHIQKRLEHEGIQLDFFSFHIYSLTVEKQHAELEEFFQGKTATEVSEFFHDLSQEKLICLSDNEAISQSIDAIIDQVKQGKGFQNEYWITEWNANPNSRDLVHDTCFMAPFIVENVLRNSHKVAGMGFWTFSDIFEEIPNEMPLFHGGFGLMTYNGIPKAAYHAWVFLSRLGSEILLQDKGIIITRSVPVSETIEHGTYQILLYHYVHYNALYRQFDYSQISPLQRYDVFESANPKDVDILLKDLQGEYVITTERVNRNHGSAFDAWVRMGAPEYVIGRSLEALQAAAVPSYHERVVEATGELLLSAVLEPHEIQLIQVKKLL